MTARELPILFSGGMVRKILSNEKVQTRRIVKFGWDDWNRDPSGVHMVRCNDGWPAFTDAKLDARGRRALAKMGGVRPRYPVGTRLWVRETHRVTGWDDANTAWIEYRASPELGPKPKDILTDDIDEWHEKLWRQLTKQGWVEKDGNMVPPVKGQKPHWKPSIFLEKWMSRITLEVTQVRVERLQDISEGDAVAEGVSLDVGCPCEGDEEDPGPKHLPLCRFSMADWPGETPLGVDDPNRMAYAALWESINGNGSWARNPFAWAYSFKRVA